MILTVTLPQIKRTHILAIALIAFFLAGTAFYRAYIHSFSGFMRNLVLPQLSLEHENVAAAWFSSMLLLLAGLLSMLCFFADRQKYPGKVQRALSLGWLFTTLVFGILSFDEMGSIHEYIGESDLFKGLSGGSGWVLFQVLVVGVALAMLLFSWVRLRKVPASLAFFVIGVLFYLSNPLQESFEVSSMRESANPESWQRPLHLLLLEEGSELAGSYCFIIASIIYLKRLANGATALHITLPEWRGAVALLGTIILAIGAVATYFFTHQFISASAEAGIPANWFPAALAFLVFVRVTHLQATSQLSQPIKFLLAAIALLSICFSLFAGINLFAYPFVHQPFFQAFLGLIVLVGLIAFIASLRHGISVKSCILLAACMAMLLCCIFFAAGNAALFIYGAFACCFSAIPFLFVEKAKQPQAVLVD